MDRTTSLWLTIVAMGIITFGLRLSMIALSSRYAMPHWMRRGLRFVPPAVLSAIFVPEMLLQAVSLSPLSRQLRDGLIPVPDMLVQRFHIALDNYQLLAGLVAILVAWRTKNVMVTIVCGLAVLWALTQFIG